MCGIFGVITKNYQAIPSSELRSTIDLLFKLSESRGKEAAGIAFMIGNTLTVYKEPISSKMFIKKESYYTLFKSLEEKKLKKAKKAGDKPLAIIGHSRLATHGFQTHNRNNQPVSIKDTVGVHNGIIANDKSLWKKVLKRVPNYEVDTEVLLQLIEDNYHNGHSFEQALQNAYAQIEGSASIAAFMKSEPNLFLATNTGSLYVSQAKTPKSLVFASESYILREVKKKNSTITSNLGRIIQISPGTAFKINLFSLEMSRFNLNVRSRQASDPRPNKKKRFFSIKDISDPDAKADQDTIILYSKINSLNKLKQHDFDYEAIMRLRRCSKCILPETTPFISFNEDGVCNYCLEHRNIEYKGKKALIKLIEPYRSKNGEPDCILAFSGGRDSSYGLHFLKKELGLNPIAYTYDWGMVTDLARNNEARMVGKLGVEHIIVSADITVKRDHIRKHIMAWMKKPDLGMVPLFMEGDKQCEYYADQLGKKTGIKLIFFTRGNEFEKEEFKTGHCGIKDADPGGVIHDLSLKGKMQIAFYYAWQYITNPAYINTSIFDTMFAYFSTYVQKHDYIFLWHYIPWEEEKIISTLKTSYGWKTSPETKASWRTDDGTSAFYNYIYYTGQGFTENDSFRARQIRERALTRKKALELVSQENKPRYKALKWYFDRVGLDGHQVLTVVDNMPKLIPS